MPWRVLSRYVAGQRAEGNLSRQSGPREVSGVAWTPSGGVPSSGALLRIDEQSLSSVGCDSEELNRELRYLNGIYTQTFNRRHQRVGHQFGGLLL